MSSRLLASAQGLGADGLGDLGLGVRQGRPASGGESARPASTVSGVRRSCESADNKPLRSRSDSIRTKGVLGHFNEMHPLQCHGDLASEGLQQTGLFGLENRFCLGSRACTPRVRMGAFSGK